MSLFTFRGALDVIAGRYRSMIGDLIRSLYTPQNRDEAIRQLAPPLTALVREGRKEAYREAGDFIKEAAAAQGVANPYVPAASGYSEASVRTVLDEDLRGDVDDAVTLIAPRLGQHVEAAARQTIVRSVEDGRAPATKVDREHFAHDALSPAQFRSLEERQAQFYRQAKGLDGVDRSVREARAKSWARVLSGPQNCAFCIMLASRGPVYSSAEDAGRIRASEAFADADAVGWANTFHPNCDCLVVPIYTYKAWPGREDWEKLWEFYKVTQENADPDTIDAKNFAVGAIRQELARMADAGVELDVTDWRRSFDADESSGGAVTPAPAVPAPPDRPELVEGVSDSDERASWTRRREALRSELGDEPLHTHEIEFLERFEQHGHRARWLPRAPYVDGQGREPTNDFEWLNQGGTLCELKTSSTKYATISGRIRDAVVKANDRGVVKENFIIDLGPHHLLPKLRSQLEQYNRRKPTARIKSLWVMHGDGKVFEEIDLLGHE